MIKLTILKNNIFNISEITDEDILDSESFSVPKDFLDSPYLSRNNKDDVIYLQDSEYYPPENLYAVGNSVNFLLKLGDYYDMFKVKSFIKLILSSDEIELPLTLPSKLPFNVILHILKLEEKYFWNNTNFERGKAFSTEILSNIKYDYNMIKNVPTHPLCFKKSSETSWDNIKSKLDIKKLLYLGMEYNMHANSNILRIATSFSEPECYPYDDLLFNKNFEKNTPRSIIKNIDIQDFYLNTNILIFLILTKGGEILYSEDILKLLLNKSPDHITINTSSDDYLDCMVNDVLITKESENKYKMRYSYKYRSSRFHEGHIINNIIRDEDSKLTFKLRLYFDHDEDKPEIIINYNILTYFCTGILPVHSTDELFECINSPTFPIGIDKRYVINKEINNSLAEKFKDLDTEFYKKLINSYSSHNLYGKGDLINYVVKKYFEDENHKYSLSEYEECVEYSYDYNYDKFNEKYFIVLNMLFSYIDFKIVDDDEYKVYEITDREKNEDEDENINVYKYDNNVYNYIYSGEWVRTVNNSLLINDKNMLINYDHMKKHYYVYHVHRQYDKYDSTIYYLYLTENIESKSKPIKSLLMNNKVSADNYFDYFNNKIEGLVLRVYDGCIADKNIIHRLDPIDVDKLLPINC